MSIVLNTKIVFTVDIPSTIKADRNLSLDSKEIGKLSLKVRKVASVDLP